MDIDETTLSALSKIHESLRQTHYELERLEFLSSHIIRPRGLFVMCVCGFMFSFHMGFLFLIAVTGYQLYRNEPELRSLRSREESNRDRVKELVSVLNDKYKLDFNFGHSFIHTLDSKKRLHLNSGNWVPYYE